MIRGVAHFFAEAVERALCAAMLLVFGLLGCATVGYMPLGSPLRWLGVVWVAAALYVGFRRVLYVAFGIEWRD